MQSKTPTLDPHEPEKMHAQARISGNGFVWPTLGVVVNQPYLNSSACAWFTRLFATERAGLPILTIESIGNESELAERFGHCDYLLVRTGLDHADSVQPVELRVEEMIRNHPEQFKEVARFPTPVAGCEGVVYQCW